MSDAPALVTRRTTIVLLVLAPALEVIETLLSPLKGTSTRADLLAIHAHEGVFVLSVLVGLASTLLYLPAYVGLAGLTASRSPRLAITGAVLSGASMVCFGGVRMVSAVELAIQREPLSVTHAASVLDGLASNPLTATVLAVFLGAMALGFPFLAASCWRAGLPRTACVAWGVLPLVAFFVDDTHWGNVATHTLLLGALTWIAVSLRGPVGAALAPRRLLSTPTVVALLLVAPVLEILEQVLSPLATTSTRADVVAIAAHQSAFTVSVLIGGAATMLSVPAFAGLATRCLAASPRVARVAAATLLVSMTGFMAVRTAQSVELQGVRSGLGATTTAHLADHTLTTAVGAVLLVAFLGGSVVGLVALAVAAWRQGLSRTGCVLMGLFPVADLVLPGHPGTIASHTVLLVALALLSRDLLRSPRAGINGASAVQSAAEPPARRTAGAPSRA
jgi:hypothetical protein